MQTHERKWLLSGVLIIMTMLLSVVTWAIYTEIDGAIIATAQVTPKGKSKTIQHIEGGIVREILVRDGDVVEINQPLIRLDDTLLQANLSIINNQLIEAAMQEARLQAERYAINLAFPKKWLEFYDESQLTPIFDEQLSLYEARQKARSGQIEQLNEQVAQSLAQIAGYEGLMTAKSKQLEIIEEEINDKQILYKQGNISKRDVRATEQQQAILQGEISELTSNISRTRASISEIMYRIMQVDVDFRERVLKELRDVSLEIKELMGQRLTITTKLERLEIRAPVSGEVMELAMHTEAGVIQPAKPILKIVPQQDDLLLEARIETQHIDQVEENQAAFVRFSAFSRRDTTELEAKVVDVSADSVEDEGAQKFWYIVSLELLKGEVAKLGDNKVIPGMPVEVFIKTQPRNIISYFTKPFTDQLMRAFREE